MSSNSTATSGYPSGEYDAFNGKVLLTALLVFGIVLMVYIALKCLNRCLLGGDAMTAGFYFNMNSVRRSNQSQPTRPGLHPSVIAALPVVPYHKGREDEDGDGPVECTVCLGQLEEGEKVRVLPRCKHLFHVNCIDMWLFSHSTCPVCRADAEPPDSLRSPGSLAVVMAGLANAKDMGSTSGLGASFRQMVSTDLSGRNAHSSIEVVQDLERL